MRLQSAMRRDDLLTHASGHLLLQDGGIGIPGDDSVVLLDSLPTSSYEGTGPTTAGRRAGHITGAVSLPYGTLFEADTGLFKQQAELRRAFADVGITQGVPILAY